MNITDCFSVISAVIEDNNDCESVYILGDFNAHPKELFCDEMLSFCSEQKWCCIDISILGLESDTYTFTSESHGSDRWLDHCICSKAAQDTVRNVWVQHDVYWSDHFPLFIECDIAAITAKCGNSSRNTVSNQVNWGERGADQIEVYHSYCNENLKMLDLPEELASCSDTLCSNPNHTNLLSKMYCDVVGILTEGAILSHNRKCKRKGGYVIGWNKYVAGAHRDARLKFQLWILAGKPHSGSIYNDMCMSRKFFKSKLKWCQDRQDQIKMDILASKHAAGDFKNFWKQTNRLNPKSGIPVSVSGESNLKSIANMFKDHFMVQSPLTGSAVELGNGGVDLSCAERKITSTAKDIDMVIRNMRRGKSPGHDGLSIEHFKYAGDHLPHVLAMFFNLCLSHSFLPEPLMRTVVVPIVKNKTGDMSDKSNYRPISLATTTAKILDSVLNRYLGGHLCLNDAQFGFRAGLSTESAILSLKHTVRYYTQRNTPIYACFLDLSKAFDLVDYNLLWKKLSETGMPVEGVSLLRYWYKNQVNQVRWVDTFSDEYRLECGVRQGGLTSPSLFNLYINELIEGLSSIHVGCYIDGTCVNNLSYADDMVLLAPSINALRKLVSTCERYAVEHGLKYNSKKSEVLIFKAGKLKPTDVPPVVLDGSALKVVSFFKYLGHMLTEDLRDDMDIERERRALAVRSNMLARRFARSTKEVKLTLFRAYCQTFYSSSLWVQYTQRAYSALRVQYNNSFRVLLGLPRHCSASGMFAEARVDGFHAIIRKKVASMFHRLRSSPNSILNMIASQYCCPIQKYWIGIVTGKTG